MPLRDRAAYFRTRRDGIREAAGKEKQATGRTESELKKLLAVDKYGQRRPLFPSGAFPADPMFGDHRPTVEHLEGVGVQLSTKKIGRHEEVPFFSTLNPHFNYKAVVMSIYSPDPEDPTKLIFSIICGAESATTFGLAMTFLDDNSTDQGAPVRVRDKVSRAIHNSGTSCFWPDTQYRTHFRLASDFDDKPPESSTLLPWLKSAGGSGESDVDIAEAEVDDEVGSLTLHGSNADSAFVAAASTSTQLLISSFRSNRAPPANGPNEIVDLSHIVELRQGFQSVIDDHFPRPKRGSAIKANALIAALAETVDLTTSDDEEENPIGGEDDDDEEEEEDEEDPPMKKRRV